MCLVATCWAGQFASGSRTMVRYPRRAAAMASMRPSWPPPRIPMAEPGCRALIDRPPDAQPLSRFALPDRHPGALQERDHATPELLQPTGPHSSLQPCRSPTYRPECPPAFVRWKGVNPCPKEHVTQPALQTPAAA